MKLEHLALSQQAEARQACLSQAFTCQKAHFTCQKPRRARLLRGTSPRLLALRQESLYNRGEASQTRQRLFGDIAPVYDELNDRLSLGLHKVWKRMAVKWANVKPGSQCIDLCCGSGDLAFLMAKYAGASGQVVAVDFAEEMLRYAVRREESIPQQTRQLQADIKWLQGDALDLPFSDASFDAATMGYGLRNVKSIPKALSELRRVLKAGSFASILDFNNASKSIPLADLVQKVTLEYVVVPTARSYGLEDEYAYLRPSIEAFPTGRELEKLAKESGFQEAIHYEIAFGLMGILKLKA